MNTLRKLFTIAAFTFLTLFLLVFYFVFFDSHGLPESDWLTKFAPNVNSLILNPSTGAPINIIPYSSINDNFTKAFSLAVAGEDPPSRVSPTLISLFTNHRPTTGLLIARTFKYNQSDFWRQINEVRMAIQIDYRFSSSQRLTILVNRTQFTPNTTGVADASEFLFHSVPDVLKPSQAATLAALAQRPSLLSEPDALLEARNKILVQLLTGEEAEKATKSPLGFK